MQEIVSREIRGLSDEDLAEVAEFVSYLKFRSHRNYARKFDESELAELYAEFADENRRLAEEGIEDYARNLAEEDA